MRSTSKGPILARYTLTSKMVLTVYLSFGSIVPLELDHHVLDCMTYRMLVSVWSLWIVCIRVQSRVKGGDHAYPDFLGTEKRNVGVSINRLGRGTWSKGLSEFSLAMCT